MKQREKIPDSLEAEIAVLSCALLSPGDVLPECGKRLTGAHFHTPAHRVIYEALAAMSEAGETIDLVTLSQRLSDAAMIEKIGGPEYLHEMLRTEATSANLRSYIEILCEKFVLRRIMETCQDIYQSAVKGAPAEDLLGRLEDSAAVIVGNGAGRPMSQDEWLTPGGRKPGWYSPIQLKTAIRDLYHGRTGKVYSTGWPRMDKHFNFHPGDMVVVTGIPYSGKSEFVDQLVFLAGQLYGWKTAYFSFENLPNERHAAKHASRRIGRNFFGTGRMTEGEMDEAIRWMEEHVSFWNPGDRATSIDTVLYQMKIMRDKIGIKIGVIDPWNSIEHRIPQGGREDLYLSLWLDKIKRFSSNNDMIVIIVAHPRAVKQREDGEYEVPQLYSISGGSMWRNKCDVGLVVHRWFTPQNYGAPIEVHIQKVRLPEVGTHGMVQFHYDRASGIYSPVELAEEDRQRELVPV